MGRHKRMGVVIGLVMALAALAPAAGAGKPHKKKPEAKPLSFRVTWTVAGGTWSSHYDCHCNHEIWAGIHIANESDVGLQFEATYDDVKITEKELTPAVKVEASSWSAKGSFSMNEDVWTDTDPDYSIDCNGRFAKSGEAPVLSASSGVLDSHFLVQSGKAFKIANVTGANCPGLGKWQPFWPVSAISPETTITPEKYVQDMLTVPVNVELSLLRHMKVGDVVGFTGHHGLYAPPSDCEFIAPGGATCTESLDFTGHLRVERTR